MTLYKRLPCHDLSPDFFQFFFAMKIFCLFWGGRLNSLPSRPGYPAGVPEGHEVAFWANLLVSPLHIHEMPSFPFATCRLPGAVG